MGTKSKLFSFTLIEMLIVMALITMCLGTSIFYIPKALKKERFEKAVSHVISKISLAQEMSIDYQMDLSLIFEKCENGKKIKATICPAQETSRKWQRALNRHVEIEEITQIAFNGKIEERLELPFDGKIGSSPKGELVLQSQEHTATIVLKGYPGKLQKGDYKEYEIYTSYPEEILSAS